MSKPDCLRCGLCCCAPSGQGEFCDVTEEEAKRLPKKFRLKLWYPSAFDLAMAVMHHESYPHAALKTRQAGDFTACVALEGTVGKKVKCAIYKDRPHVCHDAVVPGDKACRSLRKIYKEDLCERS